MTSRHPGSPAEQSALNTFTKMARATGSVLRAVEPGLRQAGLSLSQFAALEALYHLGPMGPRDLGKKILKSGANMTTVVDQLEKAGLARRHGHPRDRRCLEVRLTSAGQKKMRALFPRHAAAMARAFSALDAAEQKTLGQLCKKLGLSLRKEKDHENAGKL